MKKMTLSNQCSKKKYRVKTGMILVMMLLFIEVFFMPVYASGEPDTKPRMETKLKLKSRDEQELHNNTYMHVETDHVNNFDNRQSNSQQKAYSSELSSDIHQGFKVQGILQGSKISHYIKAQGRKGQESLQFIMDIWGRQTSMIKVKVKEGKDRLGDLRNNHGTAMAVNPETTEDSIEIIRHKISIIAELSRRQFKGTFHGKHMNSHIKHNGISITRKNAHAVFCAVQKQKDWIIRKSTLF